MSDYNPFDDLDKLDDELTPLEEESINRIGQEVEGSYNMTRDIFTAISTLTDKIFTVFSGVLEMFDGSAENVSDEDEK